ncbi:MAG TPA: DUF2130 domain-containing protein [Candidatus Saccharimonadales bacterium]|nr:DUF2130 domain-containing protein [Candidatus Saccharimonadales bacterium]
MVKCKHCGKEFELSEALTHQVTEKALSEELEKHKREVEVVRKEAEEKAFKKAEDEMSLKLKNTQNEAEETAKKNEELREKQLELSKELRNLKEKDKDREIEMQKTLEEKEEIIRTKAEKDAEEKQHLLMAAKDKQLQDAQKELEDAKRKLQQGSQQGQGEVFELEFEKILQREFPHDKIKPVSKGVRGADIIQEVWDARGNYNGKILWELKNTKPPWKEEWATTLKKNKREIAAEEAVLITEVLPKEIKTSGYREGIWVTEKNFVVGLASALRASLIQIFYIKEAAKGKDEKVEILYSYLSGVEFKHRIENIVEAFSNIQARIEKEKRYFSSKWTHDEKDLRLVIDNTFGMHGDFKHIMGNNLPEIKGFEIDENLPKLLQTKNEQQELLEE